MAAIFAVACIVRWIDLSGFGQTWDEDVNWAAGRNYVTNLLVARFLATASWLWNFEHPPVMKYLDGHRRAVRRRLRPGARAVGACGSRSAARCWCRSARGCSACASACSRRRSRRCCRRSSRTARSSATSRRRCCGGRSAMLLALGVHDDAPVDGRRAALSRRLARSASRSGSRSRRGSSTACSGRCASRSSSIQAPPRWRRETLISRRDRDAARRARHVLRGVAAAVAASVRRARTSRSHKLDSPHSPEPFLGAITNQPGAALLPRLPVRDAAARRARSASSAALCALAARAASRALVDARVARDPARRRRVAGAPGRRALRDAVRRSRSRSLAAAGCDQLATCVGVARTRSPALAAALVALPRHHAGSHPPVLPRLLRRAGRRRRRRSRRSAGSRPRGGARASTAPSPTSTSTPRPGATRRPRLHPARAPGVVPRGSVDADGPLAAAGDLDRAVRRRSMPDSSRCPARLHRRGRKAPRSPRSGRGRLHRESPRHLTGTRSAIGHATRHAGRRARRASTPTGAPPTTSPSARSTCRTTRCCASRCAPSTSSRACSATGARRRG